jgi:hypothetical protein
VKRGCRVKIAYTIANVLFKCGLFSEPKSVKCFGSKHIYLEKLRLEKDSTFFKGEKRTSQILPVL